MTPQEWWWLSLGIGAVVVAVVAILLGLIIATARSIDGHAKQIWVVGKQIAGNTATVWTLSEIAGATPRIRRAAESLEESAATIAESLGGGTAPGLGRRGEGGTR